MNEALVLLGVVCGGAALGLFYFGTLWLTVQRMGSQRNPGLWLVLGFLVRISLTLGGLYWLFGDKIIQIALAMGGFIIGRTIVFRYLGPDMGAKSEQGGTKNAANSR